MPAPVANPPSPSEPLDANGLRLVLGLKLRARRESRGWTLAELARRAKMSVSYLSEVEQGKKSPKPGKLLALARALGVAYDEIVSPRVEGELEALSAFASSEFVREFPFELFGVVSADVVRLLSGDPERSGALLRAFGEVVRRHDLGVEQFLFAALRAYQTLRENSFPEAEEAAERFRTRLGLEPGARVDGDALRDLLVERHGYRIEDERLEREPELAGLRSAWAPGPPPVLHLNGRLGERQRAFAYARELGFLELGVADRPATSSWIRAETFDQVLANLLASNFAGAVLMPHAEVAADIEDFFAAPRLEPERLFAMLDRFGATPEMLAYRIGQVAPTALGMKELFFARFHRAEGETGPRLTKVINLSDVAVPFDVAPSEHVCRRWPGVRLLEEPGEGPEPTLERPRVAAALGRFQLEPSEFLQIAMARRLRLAPDTVASVSLGFRVDDNLRRRVGFLDDPAIARLDVDLTCERCPIPRTACAERVAPPRLRRAAESTRARLEALGRLLASAAPAASGSAGRR